MGIIKKTQQGVPYKLLPYLYNTYMVHAYDKQSYPKVYMLFIGPPYYYHKINMFLDIIVLVSSTTFQTYNITSCDHGHMPLHYTRKTKTKEILNQEKQIKRKEKIEV